MLSDFRVVTRNDSCLFFYSQDYRDSDFVFFPKFLIQNRKDFRRRKLGVVHEFFDWRQPIALIHLNQN